MHILQVTFLMSLVFGTVVLLEVLPPRGVKQITVIELRDMLKSRSENGYQYIDVRASHEFNRLHVFGFKNIPLNELKGKSAELSRDMRVVVISQKGLNGNVACKLLKRKGFTDLVNVRGGIISWEPHG